MTDAELDKMVAEKVMGWTKVRVGYEGTPDETKEQVKLKPFFDAHQVNTVGWYFVRENTGICKEADDWSPSTNIADAMEVRNVFPVEWSLKLWGETAPNGRPWHFALFNKDAYSGPCESIPRAICLAALRAKGVDV